jgi:biotin carboxyl carrier protein
MKTYHVTVNGKELTVRLAPGGKVSFDGRDDPLVVTPISESEFSVTRGSRQVRVVAVRDGESFDAIAGEFRGRVDVESERGRLLRRYARSTSGSGAKLELRAPMPAMVIKIEVGVGSEVTAGQPLVVLEAMKMENEILSPGPGRVKAIYAKAGKPVEKGELLLLFE